jgi:hypothetical protein
VPADLDAPMPLAHSQETGRPADPARGVEHREGEHAARCGLLLDLIEPSVDCGLVRDDGREAALEPVRERLQQRRPIRARNRA